MNIYHESDDLAPARGILNGIAISVLLWIAAFTVWEYYH